MTAARRAMKVIFFLAWLGASAWAVEGTFQGKVVGPGDHQPLAHGWIYIQGRNHLLRRVEVSHASIVFSENIPPVQRHKCGVECLTEGIEVRVTAEQDSSGEWRARRIEILAIQSGENKNRVAGLLKRPEKERPAEQILRAPSHLLINLYALRLNWRPGPRPQRKFASNPGKRKSFKGREIKIV